MNNFISYFIGNACISDHLDTKIFCSKSCISLIISKLVVIGLILFSSCVKLPQIGKIIHCKCADGISIVSILMEIPVNTFSFAYHKTNDYPFSTFGETFFVFIQNVIIGFFVTHLEKTITPEVWNFYLLFNFSILLGAIRKLIPLPIIEVLWAICIPLSIANKIPQILLTYTQKKRGNYSRLSAFLRAIGSLGRVFTTFREISDFTVKCSSLINLLLTSTIFIQSIIYPVKKDERLLL